MKFPLLLGLAAAVAVSAFPAAAVDRYAERPPVVVSPDLSAPWVMQLQRKPVSGWRARTKQVPDQADGFGVRTGWQTRARQVPQQRYSRVTRWQPQPDDLQTAAVPPQPQ